MTDTFDFIVVGGGSGGCTVASRLSEDPGTSVALLEAAAPTSAFAINSSNSTRESALPTGGGFANTIPAVNPNSHCVAINRAASSAESTRHCSVNPLSRA